MLAQGLRAGPAALRWPRRSARRPERGPYRLNAAARDYLARNDAAHRGGLLGRGGARCSLPFPPLQSKPAAAR